MDITSYLLGKQAGGGDTPSVLEEKEITITSNGETTITPSEGYDGISSVDLTTNVQPILESKSVTISTNTTTTIQPDEGKDGLSSVEVTTAIPQPSGKINITQNGTDIDVSSYALADVSVPSSGITINGTLENKTIASGSVNKGDFVAKAKINVEHRISSLNNVSYTYGNTITDINNLIDNNDNTYCTGKGTSTIYPRFYFRCPDYSALNIPSNAELINLSATVKYDFDNYVATYSKLISGDYTRFVPYNEVNSSYSTSTRTPIVIDDYTSGDVYPKVKTVNLSDYYVIKTQNIHEYGINLMNQKNYKIYVYYVKFIVTYKINNKVYTITTDGEEIAGIANENGTAGDTIQVYVPNTSN